MTTEQDIRNLCQLFKLIAEQEAAVEKERLRLCEIPSFESLSVYCAL